MHNADRIQSLGTETAFAVASLAAAHAAAGGTVYPFHLGDLNMATPQNVREAADRAMRDGKTNYCPPAGIAPLRDALAQDTNAKRGTTYSMENVSVQPGGKPVISKFLLALMNPGDEVLCPNPGFPIYESQIEFFGGKVLPYPVLPAGDHFTIDRNHGSRESSPLFGLHFPVQFIVHQVDRQPKFKGDGLATAHNQHMIQRLSPMRTLFFVQLKRLLHHQ